MTRESARARGVFQALILLVAMAVAFLGGMLVERLQFHAERDAMLRRYDQALQRAPRPRDGGGEAGRRNYPEALARDEPGRPDAQQAGRKAQRGGEPDVERRRAP